MPPLTLPRRRLHPSGFACLTAAACLCSVTLRAQAPLCTLTFTGPATNATLDAASHACLNQATAQFHSHAGTRILLSGSNAERVSMSRQYLMGTNALPASGVSAVVTPGDPHLVTVALLPSQKPQPHLLGPAPPPPTQLPSLHPEHHHEFGAQPQPTPVESAAAKTGVPQSLPLPALPLPTPQFPASIPHHADGPAPATSTAASAKPVPSLHTHSASAAQAQLTPSQPAPGYAQPGQPAATQPLQPYPAGEAIQKWEEQLRSGGIEFNSPQTMVAGIETGVVVIIHGYADTSHSDIAGVQQQGTVKVSDYMRVDLDAPLTPGEFTITPAQGAIKPIPVSGSNMWTFQVTPRDGSSDPQTLVVHPYLYPPSKLDAQPLQERNFTVTVTVESLRHHLVRLWHQDPVKVLQYLLPGGKGWSGLGAFLTGFIALLTALGVVAWVRRKIDPENSTDKK